MKLFTWIKGLLQPQKGTIRVNGGYQPCSHGGTPNPPPSDPDGPDEMPSDELMERWKSIASHEWLYGGPPVSHRVALLAIAWARQQQAQAFQPPPPGADPVATDGELAYLFMGPRAYDAARRAIYARGRADERTAILRALGVEP